MRYISTRGQAPAYSFCDVLLTGLAEDGGLYVPESWPELTPEKMRSLRGMSYADAATEIMWPFVEGCIAREAFDAIVKASYATFSQAAVTPLQQIDNSTWLLELFHGPTLAFKDVALQLLGRLFDHVLAERQERVTIVGATSGDTGSAAIEAFRDREAIDIFILHPHGRTSEVQRRQMTSVVSDNVHNIALEGTFDDCQDMVKAMFADTNYRRGLRLSAVNSINWARIMAQTVYYVIAAVALGAPDRQVSFAVPTGNFGNVYAGYCAKRMGVPISQLIIGSNANDILHRFFETGKMEIEGVTPTLSPAMDIQVSSNFERLLFELFDRNDSALADTMAAFKRTHRFSVGDNQLAAAKGMFRSARTDDNTTLETMAAVYAGSKITVDPHTAVGINAARRHATAGEPTICLACAHPAKFPEPVTQATGHSPSLPDNLADLFERRERFTRLPNDLAMVKEFVAKNSRTGS